MNNGPSKFQEVTRIFCEVSQTGNAMTTRSSRICSTGQGKTKTFSDEIAAASAVARPIEEKNGERQR
jgi:predicted DNA-binding WGR domain protein